MPLARMPPMPEPTAANASNGPAAAAASPSCSARGGSAASNTPTVMPTATVMSRTGLMPGTLHGAASGRSFGGTSFGSGCMTQAAAAAAAWVMHPLPKLVPPKERPLAAPWSVPGIKPVLLITVAVGMTVGVFEAALPPRAEQLGLAAAAAGPLLAFAAVGSGIGGILASGMVGASARANRLAPRYLVAMGLLILPLAFLPTVPLLAGSLFLAGLPIAPLNALGAMRLHASMPAGRQAEGFSVYVATIVLGAGLGQSAVGALLERTGPAPLLAGGAAVPLLVALVIIVVRSRPRPRASSRGTAAADAAGSS